METLRIAASALNRNKLRSFLTLLGVIIGVMTVVSVVSVISGLNNYINEKVFDLNPDVFIVTRFGIITSREEFIEALKRKNIEMSDYRLVESRCRSCEMVGAGIRSQHLVKRASKRIFGVTISAGTANMADLYNIKIADGRFYMPSEERHSAQVAVIGTDVRDELFGDLDPIGRTISFGGRTMKVIGVLEKQGSVLGQNQDKQLYIPLSTYRKIYGSRATIDLFIRPVNGIAGLQTAQDEVRTIIRTKRKTPFHGDDPFGVVTGEALQKVWRNISAGAFALMICISGISLIVGGIVIMNIMLVSVIERTQEIGIRRALGARRRDILLQFLTEAVLLALGGGFAGVMLGVIISKAIAAASPLPTLVLPVHIAIGLSIALVTGAAAGFFPARRAAMLAPVESLRYE